MLCDEIAALAGAILIAKEAESQRCRPPLGLFIMHANKPTLGCYTGYNARPRQSLLQQ
jgi:hypothetical protein